MSSFQSLFNESNVSVNFMILVDNITIGFTTDGKLQVLDNGISTAKILNLAVTNAKINDMDAIKLTGTLIIPIDTSTILANLIELNNGSVSSPSLTFKSDTTTGIYKSSSGEIAITTSGVQVARFNTSVNVMNVPFFCNGTINCSPNDLSCGNIHILGSITSSSIANIGGALTCPSIITGGIGCGNINCGSINTSGNSITCGSIISGSINTSSNSITTSLILNADGSPTSPSYSFGSDTTIGLFKVGVVTMGIASNGIEVARFNNSQVQINVPLLMGTNFISSAKLSLGDGTTLLPSLTFSTDTTIGICHVLANTMSFISNAIECFRVNYGGCQFLNNLSMGSNTLTTGTLVVSTTETLSYANTKSFVYCDSSKNLVTTATTGNGQILIGSSSGSPAPATLTGTVFQTTITNGSNSIQISLPQNIHVSATPTFGRLYLIGTNTLINAGYNTLQFIGTDSSSSAPSTQYFTTIDNFPNMQLLGFTHNNINLSFDSYYDGSWRSGSTTSNYQISKNSNKLNINYSPSTVAGNVVTWNSGIVMNDSGQVSIGNTTSNASGYSRLQLYGINNSSTSPALVLFTDQDNSPNCQLIGQQHNNINLTFDGYWNGSSYISSSTLANFQISKNNSRLYTYFSPATTVSIPITWTTGTCLNALGQISLGTDIVANGTAKLTIYGSNNSSGGPHISTITTVDNYPIVNIASLQHDSIYMGFDTYHDGSNLRSSSSTANFLISKVSAQLQVSASAGNAQGTTPSFNLGTYWDTSGNLIQNQNLIINGNVSSGGQPYITYESSSSQAIANNSNVNYTGWDTSIDNQGGMSCDGTNFTVPVAGIYQMTCAMNAAANATGARQVWFLYSGNRYGNISFPAMATIEWRGSTSAIIKMTAGSSILVRVFQTSGGSLNMGSLTAGVNARLSLIKLY